MMVSRSTSMMVSRPYNPHKVKRNGPTDRLEVEADQDVLGVQNLGVPIHPVDGMYAVSVNVFKGGGGKRGVCEYA